MNKEFIPYEQALELKELGFDEHCFGYYALVEVRDYKNNGLDIRNEMALNAINGYRKYDDESQTPAPLYQQAFRWFREKHNVRFYIQSSRSDLGVYFKLLFPDGEQRGMYYNTYEEAELACLKKLIEIVKNK